MIYVTTPRWLVSTYNSLSCTLFVGFFLPFFLFTAQAGFVLSADRPTGSAGPAADNQHTAMQQTEANGLQFMGVVDVGERQLIMLLPGESVAMLYCQQGIIRMPFIPVFQFIITLKVFVVYQ